VTSICFPSDDVFHLKVKMDAQIPVLIIQLGTKVISPARINDWNFSVSVSCLKVYGWSRKCQVGYRKRSSLPFLNNLVVYIVVVFFAVNAHRSYCKTLETRSYRPVVNLIGVVLIERHRDEASQLVCGGQDVKTRPPRAERLLLAEAEQTKQRSDKA